MSRTRRVEDGERLVAEVHVKDGVECENGVQIDGAKADDVDVDVQVGEVAEAEDGDEQVGATVATDAGESSIIKKDGGGLMTAVETSAAGEAVTGKDAKTAKLPLPGQMQEEMVVRNEWRARRYVATVRPAMAAMRYTVVRGKRGNASQSERAVDASDTTVTGGALSSGKVGDELVGETARNTAVIHGDTEVVQDSDTQATVPMADATVTNEVASRNGTHEASPGNGPVAVTEASSTDEE
ncbi:unnamed protein product [Phytophthora fragariaefolia]|uniref:Unnamed protein product n=1 Tax=Phytophthora fragariaefolia TaxID=1490495 RepID=A0A9W6WTD2_9STRA|nr:unnamed protein product [Phytophthora fragariaefolia]